MTKTLSPLAALSACLALAVPGMAWARAPAGIPPEIATPNQVETRLGTLEFNDGAPTATTRSSTTIWISRTRSRRS